MTPVTWNSNAPNQPFTAPVSRKTSASAVNSAPAGVTSTTGDTSDSLQLSPAALREVAQAGRVALNDQAGNITSDQATQLYGQIAGIHSQIVADRQADGGSLSPADAQAIQQLQNQLSQTIYSDAHNGAAPPADPAASLATAREAVEAGRIALNEKAGNLNADQAGQLYSQFGTIHQQIVTDTQADGGKLSPSDARAINQSQSQLSQQIYDTAHKIDSGSAGQ
jgi:hypothetical protein